MKKLITTANVLFMLSSFANNPEQAAELFSKRGLDSNNAKKAASIYQDLARETRNNTQKVDFLTKQSQALYFFAGQQSSKKEKEKLHQKGFKVADKAIKVLTGGSKFSNSAKDPSKENKTALALAHYFSAINMGKWAEARGLLASLSEWKNMKKHLDAAKVNDETVEFYGIYRAYGRAFMKLPFTHGGSKSKSEKNLKKAYDKTINEDFETSVSTTATAYYLDILAARNNADTFCEVYESFTSLTEASDEELTELNDQLVPESKIDLKNFKSGKGYEEKIHDFADTNC